MNLQEDLSQISSRSNTHSIVHWFDSLDEKAKDELMQSADERLEDEDAETFLTRTNAKRTISQVVDRVNRQVI